VSGSALVDIAFGQVNGREFESRRYCQKQKEPASAMKAGFLLSDISLFGD
jgi:hypothetical protein